MNNYEAELNELLLLKLMEFYQVFNKETAYRIFLARFYIENIHEYKKKKYNNWDLDRQCPKFLVSELNLPLTDGKLFYKGEVINLYRAFENSLANILDDWFFQYADRLTSNKKGEKVSKLYWVEKDLIDILAEADKIIKYNRRNPHFSIYLKGTCLNLLRKRYDIGPPREIGRIDGFHYDQTHNDFKPTLDETYDRLIHADMTEKGMLNKLTEEKLERFLLQNLHLVEEGMSLISNQYVIDCGRLDILAKDKDGQHCILELKVEDDPGLVFQAIYYRIALQEQLKTDRIRILVIAPSYPKSILKALMTIEKLEIFTFDVCMDHNEIIQLKLNRIA